MKDLRQWTWQSAIGPLHLVASPTHLVGLHFRQADVPPLSSLVDSHPSRRVVEKAVQELDEYFNGRRRQFTLPVQSVGTAFQERVWQELLKIPYGGTCAYRDIAKRMHKDKAVRAVGTANGRNPLAVIVPCHRVIAADGSLGGYAGGLAIKTFLLNLEQGNLDFSVLRRQR